MKSKTPPLGELYRRLKHEVWEIEEIYEMCKRNQRREVWLRDARSGKIYVGINNGDTK